MAVLHDHGRLSWSCLGEMMYVGGQVWARNSVVGYMYIVLCMHV